MENMRIIFVSFLVICVLHSVVSLECYVCSDQDANNEKCTRTIMTCDPGDDMCLTEIKWGTMPYWQAGADKQYYISKRCATAKECDRMINKYSQYCTYIWYEDWKCAQCCAGDRCNYFVISDSTSVSFNSFLLLATAVVVFISSRSPS